MQNLEEFKLSSYSLISSSNRIKIRLITYNKLNMKKLTFILFAFVFYFFLLPHVDQIHAEQDNSALMDCLCEASCTKVNWNCSVVSCYYNPAASNASPECADTSKGECMCQGYGCGRAPLVTEGEAYNSCQTKYSPAVDGDNKCETAKGETCSTSVLDCKCGTGKVCSDMGDEPDAMGCVDISNACPTGSHLSLLSGKCACDDAQKFITKEGCVNSCPTGSKLSEATEKCECSRVGQMVVDGKCEYIKNCPSNSTLTNGKCTCDTGYKESTDGTSCVKDLTEAQKLARIQELYNLRIPKGYVTGGRENNFRSLYDSKYKEFACGGYQSKVLKFFDDLKFSSDPEERALLDNFDYGPIQAYYGGHQAVVLYPSGVDWVKNGVVFDPWPTQAPTVYSMNDWGWKFSYNSYRGIGPSSPYDKPGINNYPTVGGVYSNPNRVVFNKEEETKLFNALSPEQKAKYKNLSKDQREEYLQLKKTNNQVKVYTNSPVTALITNLAGQRIGDNADATESYNEFDKELVRPALAQKIGLTDKTYSTVFDLPNDEYQLSVVGTDDGPVTLVIAFEQEDDTYKVVYGMFDIEKGMDALFNVSAETQTVNAELTTGEIWTLPELASVEDLDVADIAPMTEMADLSQWASTNWSEFIDKKCPDGEILVDGNCTNDKLNIQLPPNTILTGVSGIIYWIIGCTFCMFFVTGIVVVVIIVVKKKKLGAAEATPKSETSPVK